MEGLSSSAGSQRFKWMDFVSFQPPEGEGDTVFFHYIEPGLIQVADTDALINMRELGIREDDLRAETVLQERMDALTFGVHGEIQSVVSEGIHMRVRDSGDVRLEVVDWHREAPEDLAVSSDQAEGLQLVSALWPDGLDNTVIQGKKGNCYFLSALTSIKMHPDGPELLANILSKGPGGTINVKFEGSPAISISPADLKESVSAGRALRAGALGDKILDRAYDRLKNKREIGDTMVSPEDGKMDVESGVTRLAFEDLFGGNIDVKVSSGIDIVNGLINTRSNRFHTASSFRKSELYKTLSAMDAQERLNWMSDSEYQKLRDVIENGLKAKIKYFATDIYGKKIKIAATHAYSVGEINRDEGWAEVINPHNTTTKRHRFYFQEIADKFHDITIAKIR